MLQTIIRNYLENNNINLIVLTELKSVQQSTSNRPCLLNIALDKSKEEETRGMRNERESDRTEERVRHEAKGDLTRGFWGLVEGGVSMWGLKGVARQPPPALRNGRHTRHTHTPLSSFAVSFSLVLPLLFFSIFFFFFFLSPHEGCTFYPAHNTYPAPYTSRVRGKFLNFARIENFHILFPRRRGAARCQLQPVVVLIVLVVLVMRQLQSNRKISQSDAFPFRILSHCQSTSDRRQQAKQEIWVSVNQATRDKRSI